MTKAEQTLASEIENTSSDETSVDVDNLPPAEYLAMETLVARFRLGERNWPFPTSTLPVLRRLKAKGVLDWESDVVAGSVRVHLTERGYDLFASNIYTPPSGTVAIDVEDLRELERNNDLLTAAVTQEVTIAELTSKMNSHAAEVQMVIGPGGGISHPALRILAAAAAALLGLDGTVAPNYHTAQFNGHVATGEEYIMEVASCRSLSQTPSALRNKAEKALEVVTAQRDALEEELRLVRAPGQTAPSRLQDNGDPAHWMS
jgi:hypothetical protein